MRPRRRHRLAREAGAVDRPPRRHIRGAHAVAPPTDAPRADISTYELDGDLIVFDERHSRLFALNSTAAFVWSRLAQNLPHNTLAEQLAEATGAKFEQVRADVDALFTEWRHAGLLHRSGGHEALETTLPAPQGPRRAAAATPHVKTSVSRSIPLMDRGVRIVSDASATDAVDSVFGPVSDATLRGSTDWPTLTLFKHVDRWVLELDGVELGTCTARDELVPLIYGNTARLLYESSDCFAVVHAAAVAKGQHCFLMPAVSASGKSTLTAALIAKGYEYCTDDLAILTGAPIRLRPVPMQIGLKSGSWEPLAQLWPELVSLPIHRRADGQLIRYLHPMMRGVSRSSNERLSVSAVVFPRFAQGSTTQLHPIPRSDALTRVAEAGYDVAGKLDRHAVQALVRWFETLDCYELPFGNLDEAVESLAEIFS